MKRLFSISTFVICAVKIFLSPLVDADPPTPAIDYSELYRNSQPPDLELSARWDKDKSSRTILTLTLTVKNVSHQPVVYTDEYKDTYGFIFYALDPPGTRTRVFPPPLKPGLVSHFSGAGTALAPGESRSYTLFAPAESFAAKGGKYVAGMCEDGRISGNTYFFKQCQILSRPFSFAGGKIN